MSPLRKRGDVYWLDTSVAGKRHRVSLGTSEYYLALDKAREIERRLGREAVQGPAITLEEFSTKYLAWAWSSKPASADRDQQRLAKVKVFLAAQGVDMLSSVTPYHIEQLRAKLRADGLEKSTVNRYFQLLRGMFYRAIEWGDFQDQNPLRKVKFFREQADVRPLTKEQVKAVRDAALAIAAAKSTSPRSRLTKQQRP